MKKIIKILLIFIALGFFCYFVYNIYMYKTDEIKSQKANENLTKVAVDIIEQKEDERIFPIEVDFQELKKQNQDIIAWIYSKGTPINYPIVQTKDNLYYLRRTIDGKYNQVGTLFVDYRNSKNFEDTNTIIYGHNMKNETMLGSILNYKIQDYYENHKEMYLLTENKKFVVEVFAGCLISTKSEIYNYPKTPDSNKKLMEIVKMKNDITTNVKVEDSDKIITLSTCSYDFENARYVVFGIIKEIDNK